MSFSEVLFSIVIPTYNRSDSIEKTIKSVLNQSFKEYELIVVDDGSTDNTKEILNRFVDGRITFIHQENSERGAARNHGIRLARGTYVTFLDSDDLLYPNHLDEASRCIAKYSNPEWFHLPYEVVDGANQVLFQPSIALSKATDPEKSLLKGNPLSCMGVFVKRQILLQELFNEDRAIAGSEDWELWMRLACQYPLKVHSVITSALIHHEQRSVINQKPERLIQRIEVVRALVLENNCFQHKWISYRGTVSAHLSGYLSLHLGMMGQFRSSSRYLIHALKEDFTFMFTRKFFGIIKQFVLR